jgi:PAS domain S-box-containing protein
MHEIDQTVQQLLSEFRSLRACVSELERLQIRADQEALRRSEERFSKVFHASPVATSISRVADQRLINVNEAFLLLCGYRREQVLGRTAGELGLWDDPEAYDELLGRLVERGSVRDAELGVRDSSGARRECLVSAELITVEAERCVLALAHDITARKRAEDALRDSERRFEQFMNHSPAVAFIKDEAGRLLYGNSSLRRLLDTDGADLIGKTADQLFPEPIARQLKKADHEVIERDQPATGVECVPGADGQARHWLTYRFPIHDGRGRKLLGVVAVDVTDRMQAEQALREQTRILHGILDSIGDGVIVTDDAGRFLIFNPAAQRISRKGPVDCSPAERSAIYGIYLPDQTTLCPPEQLPLSRAIRGERIDAAELFMRHELLPEGIWLSVTAHPVLDEDGRPRAAVAVFHDISASKRSTLDLERSRQQFRSYSAHLQTVREQERAKLARELHDQLGQSLSVLQLNATWLRDRMAQANPEWRRRVEAMSKLLDDMIGEVKRICIELRPPFLDDLGLGTAVEWQTREFQTRFGIRCRSVVDPPKLTTDRDRSIAIFRVCQEALTNVARHARAREVEVRLTKNSEAIVLEIQDDGLGIAPEQVQGGGSLGILGMRERAHLLGGQLQLRALPGGGTRVVLTVPLSSRT